MSSLKTVEWQQADFHEMSGRGTTWPGGETFRFFPKIFHFPACSPVAEFF
jgi:hypothetical protein